MRRWTIDFTFTGDRAQTVLAEATNPSDAFHAAITFVARTMKPGENYRHVYVGTEKPSDSDPNMQMPVAWAP
jgi:hypothetical protein